MFPSPQSLFQIDSNSNEYLLAKIGVDTAENEPLEVWGKFQFIIIHLPPYAGLDGVPVRRVREDAVRLPKVREPWPIRSDPKSVQKPKNDCNGRGAPKGAPTFVNAEN